MVVSREKIAKHIMNGKTPEAVDRLFQESIFRNESIAENLSQSTILDMIEAKVGIKIFSLLTQKYLHDKSNETIAEELNIPIDVILDIEDKSLKKLRADYELQLLYEKIREQQDSCHCINKIE